jgi:hypothetical protein
VTYAVRLTPEAEEDLGRLFDFVLERELARDHGDLELAHEALSAIKDGLKFLERFPFTCRKVGPSPFVRELIISFGRTGYVALFGLWMTRRWWWRPCATSGKRTITDSLTAVVAGSLPPFDGDALGQHEVALLHHHLAAVVRVQLAVRSGQDPESSVPN